MEVTFRVVCGRRDLAPLKAALHRLVDSCRDCLGSMRLAAPARVPEPEPLLHLLVSTIVSDCPGRGRVGAHHCISDLGGASSTPPPGAMGTGEGG